MFFQKYSSSSGETRNDLSFVISLSWRNSSSFKVCGCSILAYLVGSVRYFTTEGRCPFRISYSKLVLPFSTSRSTVFSTAVNTSAVCRMSCVFYSNALSLIEPCSDFQLNLKLEIANSASSLESYDEPFLVPLLPFCPTSSRRNISEL